jgi:predicted O-linked N-acetylglucosamine transferase (SPINDLY family)
MPRKIKTYSNPFIKTNGKSAKPFSPYNFNTAISLHQKGELEQAEAIYLQILSNDPSNSEALHLLGALNLEKGNNLSALELINLAIELNPKIASYHSNRGLALKELNQFEDAVASFSDAISLDPNYAEAYSNRGVALRRLNLLEAAVYSCSKAIELNPSLPEAYSNRGLALQALKKLDSALLDFEKALRLNPRYVQAHSNRGNVLQELKQFESAIASYESAIKLNPTFTDLHYNRGAALKELKNLEASLESYDIAYALKPEYPYLLGTRLHLKMQMCNWQDFENSVSELGQNAHGNSQTALSFQVVNLPISISEQRKIATTWCLDKHPFNPMLGEIVKQPRHSKIRLGYFSADFHNHATAYLMAELFERHDKSNFELIAFSFGPETNDEMQIRVSKAFDHFVNVASLSDIEVALLSRELGIDIAIDLKGVTQDSRLGIFSFKAAPIQVSYLGYPGTLGADYIDYLIADKTLIPTQSQQHYCEKIVYLPNSYQVNDRQRVIASREFSKQELGLPEDGFVFCCFNNNFKITPDVFDSWVRILKAVDGSVLWLFQDNPTAGFNLQKEAKNRGLDPARLVFATRMDLPDHLARHKAADLFLDTTPCNAHTTASDALWTGLPLLTCMGETFASRVAASLLNAIGLPELVTENAADYEALAIELATNQVKLNDLKAKLERNRLTTPLFDTELFTKHIEAAYLQMYERYQADLAPDHILV